MPILPKTQDEFNAAIDEQTKKYIANHPQSDALTARGVECAAYVNERFVITSEAGLSEIASYDELKAVAVELLLADKIDNIVMAPLPLPEVHFVEDGEIKPTCSTCQSDDVRLDAWAAWDAHSRTWELASTLDQAHCETCEGQTRLKWVKSVYTPRRFTVIVMVEVGVDYIAKVEAGDQDAAHDAAIDAILADDAFMEDRDGNSMIDAASVTAIFEGWPNLLFKD